MQEQHTNLLSTKLRIPPLHTDIVPRSRLMHRLNKAITRKLTLINAPAGFGKTTLLSEWAAQCRVAVAWISLHHDDNHAEYFLHYLIAALESVLPDIDNQIGKLFSTPYLSNTILTALLNALNTLPDDFVLVLDDYHFIHDQQIHQDMRFLLEHLPAHMHIVIASRIDLPFPLTHLRGQGQLIEVSATDLRFTHQEVTRLHEVMNLQLSPEDMVVLEKHIEGWVTGFHLAAISLQKHGDIATFTKNLSGGNRFILEYLSEEVLFHLPEHIQTFLQQTSLLDHLTGSLCDMVTARRDSQSILKLLDQQGLFITALDDQGYWYRYQHLFVEVLQYHLLQTSPPFLLFELHRRASEWYEQNEMFTEAIKHALAAKYFPRVIRLVEQTAITMWMRGDLPTLLKWLQAIPDDLVRTRPTLCLFYAWILYVFHQLSAALSYLQIAEHTLRTHYNNTNLAASISENASPGQCDPLELEYRECQHMDAIVHASSAIMQGDVTRTIEQAQNALKLLPEDAPLWRGLITLGLGFAYQSRGDIVAARQAINEACKISQHAGNNYTRLFALSTLAQLQIEQGHLSKAVRTYQQVINMDTPNGQFSTIIGWAYVGISEVYREWNNLDEATHSARKGIEYGEQGGNESITANGYTALARVKLAQGDFDDALDSIQKAEQIAKICTNPLIASHASAMEASIWIMRGNIKVAAHWTQEASLNINDELSYAHEIEHITLARLLLAEEQYDTAISFLHRLFLAAEAGGRTKKVIEILLLQALGYTHIQDGTAKALEVLGRVLLLAQPEGYIRIFTDEGLTMAALLSTFYTSQMQQRPTILSCAMREYVKSLIASFDTNDINDLQSSAVSKNFIESFSEREMEILQLITVGLSNREIAQAMVITVGTVKWYLSNIYSKLNVHSRTQALARARDLGLLP